MQAVPSLVGTGTIVAAAATGLVFAQPADDHPLPQRPGTAQPKLTTNLDNSSRASSRHAVRPISRALTLGSSGLSDLPDLPDDAVYPSTNNGSNSNISYAASNYGGSAYSAPAATSSIPAASATLPRSATPNQITPPKGSKRRHSFIHKGEWMPPPISEVSRDSISSTGSWIRRLSSRPLSQHGSLRSSIGPDSLSLNFSLGSAAPILSSGGNPTQQHSRNKLVKRTTAGQDNHAASLTRRGSRTQIPTLRRPATSHQRIATMQQNPNEEDSIFVPPSPAFPKYSFDQRTRPSLAIFQAGDDKLELPGLRDHDAASSRYSSRSDTRQAIEDDDSKQQHPTRWGSYFHERLTRTIATTRGASPLSTDSSPTVASHSHSRHSTLPNRTLQVHHGNQSGPYLANASSLFEVPSTSTSPIPPARSFTSSNIQHTAEEDASSSSHDAPSKRARRSISMHFASPTNWISRAGSIRRSKRGSDYSSSSSSAPRNRLSIGGNGRRHVSAPLPPTHTRAPMQAEQSQPRNVTAPADMPQRRTTDGVYNQWTDHATKRKMEEVPGRSSSSLTPPLYPDGHIVNRRQRNSSSPLPPLSGLSSFNMDRSRQGPLSASSSVTPGTTSTHKENKIHGRSSSMVVPRAFPMHSRDVSNGPPSTVAGSELDLRGFTSSGDDDDTDFKSDTMFDSIRTTGSTRFLTTDTPLESMFDETPPSTASNSRTKRLSIQDILGQAWDSDTRIMEEEDEGPATPVRNAVPRPSASSLSSQKYEDARAYLDPTDNNSIHHDTVGMPSVASNDTGTESHFSYASQAAGIPRMSSDDDDEDDDWARMDENGVTNHLSPPSHSLNNSLRGTNGLSSSDNETANGGHAYPYEHRRPALTNINSNATGDVFGFDDDSMSDADQPRSNLFDWSESTDKIEVDDHSPRPKTVHGKQELDMRNGRPVNRKGATTAHTRSQSVPVVVDPLEGTKPAASKFGTWASGPKNASEDWDDDFDFEASGNGHGDGNDIGGFGGFANIGSDGPGTTTAGSFAMVVPASIQATQPTVRAHSDQIRELSLLVNGLKRLCRHARELNIIKESPSLWTEAENIIALASPDDDASEGGGGHTSSHDTDMSQRTSSEFNVAGVEDRFLDEGYDAGTVTSVDDDPFDTSTSTDRPKPPETPPATDMGKTTVVRDRSRVRRRSVFSPDDDIFGGSWPLDEKSAMIAEQAQQAQQREPPRPRTPEQKPEMETPDSIMFESIMEAMQQQRSSSAPIRRSPVKQPSKAELFFNTNTLQELVKRANTLFHTLSELVPHAELITQDPACTPRHDRPYRREDGSPAFTRVFTDPSSPPKRLPKSQSQNSPLARAPSPVDSPASNGISQRLQMMTVN